MNKKDLIVDVKIISRNWPTSLEKEITILKQKLWHQNILNLPESPNKTMHYSNFFRDFDADIDKFVKHTCTKCESYNDCGFLEGSCTKLKEVSL